MKDYVKHCSARIIVCSNHDLKCGDPGHVHEYSKVFQHHIRPSYSLREQIMDIEIKRFEAMLEAEDALTIIQAAQQGRIGTTAEPKEKVMAMQKGHMATLFKQLIKKEEDNGKQIVSDKRQKGKITFDDGTKIDFTKTGHVIIRYADGKKVQHNPSGARITITADGTTTQENPNGVIVVAHRNGLKITRMRNGAEVREFPDGRKLQINADGSLVNIPADGKAAGATAESSTYATLDLVAELDESSFVEDNTTGWAEERNSNQTDLAPDRYHFDHGDGDIL